MPQQAHYYQNLASRTRNGPTVSASQLGHNMATDQSIVQADILSDKSAGNYPEELAGFGMTREHFGALAQWLSVAEQSPDTMETVRVTCATVSSLGLFRTESVRYNNRQRMGKVCAALNREYAKTGFSFTYRPAIYGDKARVVMTARGDKSTPLPGTRKRFIAANHFRWNTVDELNGHAMAMSLCKMGASAQAAANDAMVVGRIQANHSPNTWIFLAAIASPVIWPLALVPMLLGDKVDSDERAKKYSQFIQNAQVQPNLHGIAYGLERRGNALTFTATTAGAQGGRA